MTKNVRRKDRDKNKERKKISMTEGGERRDLSIQNRKRNGEVERDLYP